MTAREPAPAAQSVEYRPGLPPVDTVRAHRDRDPMGLWLCRRDSNVAPVTVHLGLSQDGRKAVGWQVAGNIRLDWAEYEYAPVRADGTPCPWPGAAPAAQQAPAPAAAPVVALRAEALRLIEQWREIGGRPSNTARDLGYRQAMGLCSRLLAQAVRTYDETVACDEWRALTASAAGRVTQEEVAREAPCQHCGKPTPLLCADCAIDKRPETHVCANCQRQHACHPAAAAPPEAPAPQGEQTEQDK